MFQLIPHTDAPSGSLISYNTWVGGQLIVSAPLTYVFHIWLYTVYTAYTGHDKENISFKPPACRHTQKQQNLVEEEDEGQPGARVEQFAAWPPASKDAFNITPNSRLCTIRAGRETPYWNPTNSQTHAHTKWSEPRRLTRSSWRTSVRNKSRHWRRSSLSCTRS